MIKAKIEESWLNYLSAEFESDYMKNLSTFLKEEKKIKTIYPQGGKIFNAFNLTPFPKVKVVIYNFEKLFHYKFSVEAVTNLVNTFPKQVVAVKDSSYNLYENLKIKDFLVFPGSEAKLLKGLEHGCAGCISAVTNVTHSLARKVFDDFENKIPQTKNDQLIAVRETFDQYNLISALHSYHSIKDENYKNILPPLTLLSEEKKRELIEKLNKLKFTSEKNLAA